MENDTVTRFSIIDIKQITHDSKQFTFAIPKGLKFEFLPGDHIKLYPDPGDQLEWRPYTPTTIPETGDHFELIIKRYSNGITSRYMHERQIGDEVLISGPHEGGHFIPGIAKNVGLVAGGTGITPFISMIRSILFSKIDVNISLIFANKSIDDIILKDEFDSYLTKYSNFKRYYLVDNAPPDWNMGIGRITPQILQAQLPEQSEQTTIFVCGPPMMQIELRKKLLDLGYQKEKIIFP
jgi:cytochrome-b5 reductase